MSLKSSKNAMSHLLAAGLSAALAFAGPVSSAHAEAANVSQIGFHFWKPGKIYDEAMAGIKDGLQMEGVKYKEVALHSDRDKGLAAENLRKLDGMGLDVIYSLSSAGTKIAKGLGLKTPVISTVINHPSSLGVGQAGEDSVTALTGTSYYVDAEKQLDLYLGMFPETKKVGMIFDAKNPAGYLAEEPFMRQACDKRGLAFESLGINQADELEPATKKLLDAGVKMIVVPTNRLVYGNLELVLGVTHPQHVPVVSMNKQGVENGALAALYADTYNLGRQAASMAKEIIVSKKPASDIDFQYIEEPDMILNLNGANKLGFEFPADVLSSATIVMQ